MSKQFKRSNKNSPDADKEFIFSSRSICVEEKTDDGLSAITDHHFGSIESYRRAQALPPVPKDARPIFPPIQQPQENRSPPPSPRDSDYEQQQTPPLLPRQESSSSRRSQQASSTNGGSQRSLNRHQNNSTPQSSRSLQNTTAAVQSSRSIRSQNSSNSNNNRSYIEEEVVEDDDDMYMDEFVPEHSEMRSATQEQFVAKVAAYNDETEAWDRDPENGRQSLVSGSKQQSIRSGNNSVRSTSVRSSASAFYPSEKPLPEQPLDEIQSKQPRGRRDMISLIVLVCLCLFLVLAGVGVAVYFVLFKEDKAPASTKGGAGSITSSTGPPSTTAPTTTVPITTTPTTTTAPSPIVQRNFALSGGPFTSSDTRFGTNPMFGYALALVGDFLAVGEPNIQTSALGDIVIRQRSGNWNLRDAGQFNVTGTRRFGYSMDGAMVGGTVASLLVGASETRDDGALSGSGAGFGSAHVYQLDSTGNWNPVGNELRPDMLLQEAGGKFGSAVSMARNVLRVAVGAPESSVSSSTLKTGRVYAYEFDGTDWQPMGSPIVGTGAGDRSGASVAMSQDGSRMLVGSPGDHNGAGAVWYYEWNSTLSQWKSIFALRGEDNSQEALGTTVAILSDDGRRIAFGGPTWGNNQGRIEVFEESTMYTGFFAKVGTEDIAGADGERVGTTMCGAKGLVAFGTESGSFRVYQLDPSNNAWTKVAEGPFLGSPVVSIAINPDVTSIAVGLDNQRVDVYDLTQ